MTEKQAYRRKKEKKNEKNKERPVPVGFISKLTILLLSFLLIL